MAWSIGRYFYRQMSRRTKERGCTRKMAEHNIVTQNRPVTCGSKNLKRESWVFGAHPFGRKETKTRILFITLDHDPLCSNYFKTLKMINKRKFLSKQQISGQGQRKNKIFFFKNEMPSSSQTDFDMSWHEEEPSVFTRSPFDEYFTGQSQIKTVVITKQHCIDHVWFHNLVQR